MICADVQSLARAAPEPVAPQKISVGDANNSFDQFLQAVNTPERASSSNDKAYSRDVSQNEQTSYQDRVTDTQTTDRPQKSVNEKKIDAKKGETRSPEEKPVSQEDTQAEAVVDENIKEAIAAAVAAQVAVVAIPVQQVDVQVETTASTENPLQGAAAPVMQNQQSPVIQLPDTEPQPLPDELKQAFEQAKPEAASFQTLVDAASQETETQIVESDPNIKTTTMKAQVAEAQKPVTINEPEPAVKIIDLNAQPDDMAQMEPSKMAANLYPVVNAKNENLVQQKTLPLVQKIGTEMVEMAREQGQSMRIQIHPEHLGKIDLRLMSNSDGMKVVMTAEVPATAKLLESHLDQLQRQLADAGVSISGMSVNSQGAQGQFTNQSTGQSQSTNVRITPTAFQPENETVAPQVVKASSSSLDYRI